jgi:branched-chain amino acid transport system ATP-binding protein
LSEVQQAAAVQSAEPILVISHLAKKFGSFQALKDVNLAVRAGEVLGLIGPNGSGKTTCINVVTGLYRPDGGKIEYRGHAIGRQRPDELARLGVNRTFQVPKPFKSLTVRQNVEVAARYGGANLGRADVQELLEFLELDQRAEHSAAELTSAQQKMLDLARALATRPKLLCVDELGAGLNPEELSQVATRLRQLAGSGLALLVVEHLMDFVDQVTDRLIVLSAGKDIFSGLLAEAAQDPQVVEVFLGTADGH